LSTSSARAVASRLPPEQGGADRRHRQGLSKFPGVIWNYSQPISDNMEEAVSGVKASWRQALRRQPAHGSRRRPRDPSTDVHVKGNRRLGIFRIVGQPNLNYNRRSRRGCPLGHQRARHSRRSADRVGANALTQVQQASALRRDAALPSSIAIRARLSRACVCLRPPASASRWLNSPKPPPTTAPSRSTARRPALHRYQVLGPRARSGLNRREAIAKVNGKSGAAGRLHLEWAGDTRARSAPTTHGNSCSRYCLASSSSFTPVPLLQVCHAHSHHGRMPLRRPLALFITGTNSGLFRGRIPRALRRSVETGVIMVELLPVALPAARAWKSRRKNTLWKPQWRALSFGCVRDDDHAVATLGLLPAALSHAIGSDSQRPRHRHRRRLAGQPGHRRLLLPTLYVWMAREDDVLPAPNRQRSFDSAAGCEQ